ncbi:MULTISPECIES: hypothetical protein [Streptomycetaceae]|uniref:hypothetical protein n=1 Tax=Streptomycetaceae TaxID=2062 RepID=UPI00093BE310|nr:hypothetical protein [Streptomyces sp. CB02056]OKI02814.1 hypothetical protein AMK13_29750 [Streptomyces sp. CB02056]
MMDRTRGSTDLHSTRVRCLMIGPIGNSLAPSGSSALKAYENYLTTLEKVVDPVCRKYGIEPVRADQIAHSGAITDELLEHLVRDEIAIADLSGGDPSVIYGLALRHLAGRPTIQIGEHGRVPFDLPSIRTLKFKRTEAGLVDVRKDLERVVAGGLTDSFSGALPPGILRKLLPSGGGGAVPPAPYDDGLAEPRILDQISKLDDQLRSLLVDMDAVTTLIETIGKAADTADEVERRIARSGDPVGAKAAALGSFGRAVSSPVVELEAAAERFAESVAGIDLRVRTVVSLADAVPKDKRAPEVRRFGEELNGMAVRMRKGSAKVEEFGSAADHRFGAGGKKLRGPGRSVSAAVHQLTAAMAYGRAWEQMAFGDEGDHP